MSVTILEALQNAKYNLIENGHMPPIVQLGKIQLTNAVTLLGKGYSLHDEVEPLLEGHESVDDVPEKV